MVFHSVVAEGFTGGFFLNRLLPWRPDDIFFADETRDTLVLMSGAVYNRDELIALSNSPENPGDPELIARLFLQYGPEFVGRLNGDFAILIWQPGKKQAYLFRDHVGIRSLAWAFSDGRLLFSTDIIALCRTFSDGHNIDQDYLSGYFRYIDNRMTPDRHVKKLLPGHYLHYSETGIELTKYWHAELIRTEKELSYDMMLSELTLILRDSVRIRSDKRFTAASHVSSGLDSGIVTGLVREEYSRQENFYGFSWSPRVSDHSEVKYDERNSVIHFCEKTGITPVFSDLSPERFTKIISSSYGNPGLFYEDRTVEQAAELGVNLLFSGWGGDEFISTGDRGVEQDLLAGLKLRTFLRRNPVKPLKRFIKNQLQYVVYPALGVLDKGTAKSFRLDARYLKRSFRKSDRRAIRNFYFHTSRRQMHLRVLQFYHLQRRCENWMINGYRQGVEYRYPLLDRRIIEYMLKIPSELLCTTDQSRPLLREMGKDILQDDIRLNNSKTDPVSLAYTRKLFRDASLSFIDEANEWKANPDLNFIDFGRLAKDIKQHTESPDPASEMPFFKAVVNIKAAHEFTKAYRKK
ncbi:MAG: asparagine synthase-related protein [Bacteroidales bacterium]|nr:asparagine synthase-related protein [Bacteroidales bacterium]